MTLREHVPLTTLTTLRVGGEARFVAECDSVQEVRTAIALARNRGCSWYVLGSGSNMLAGDEGYDGMIIRVVIPELTFTETTAADDASTSYVQVTAGAGVLWDMLVRVTTMRGLWGLENLAAIPGTVGAAPVQNIGAYGAEVAQTITSVEVLDTKTGETHTLSADACAFAYRDSIFKHDTSLIILRVTFTLTTNGTPNIGYADLTKRAELGADLSTPSAIADVVRDIRAHKFPDLTKEGTAGSFFKNPTITPDAYAELKTQHPELPGYETEQGIKISLAWILDKILQLRGYSEGPVRCYEQQPLVIVTSYGATAHDVDLFASHIAEKVFNAVGISIEREVRSI